MQPAEPVLICALSGRALAQYARAAGYAPIVLDAFADLDTRAAAHVWCRIPVDPSWRLHGGALLAAARRLAPPPIPLVWGSGFERVPDLLAELADGRELLGNPAGMVRRIKDPSAWRKMIDALGIAHPEIRLARPADPTGWLCKRTGGAGGGHVRRARHRPPRGRGWYWQRWSAGVPVSALLLGSGGDARVLAMGRQITAPLPGRRYRFGGMVVPAGISPTAGQTLEQAALALATHCRLQGLASVDALVAGDAVRVLELNPRPGGSLDAYGAALGRSLFALHVAACRDRTLPEPQATIIGSGSLIAFADRTIVVPASFAWADWTADRTPPGTLVRRGGPICTVLAQGTDRDQLERLLRARAAAVATSIRGAGVPCGPAAVRYDGAMMTYSQAAR
jgi:predicted ATP-grasp superfamily ATP-dependent carboligase